MASTYQHFIVTPSITPGRLLVVSSKWTRNNQDKFALFQKPTPVSCLSSAFVGTGSGFGIWSDFYTIFEWMNELKLIFFGNGINSFHDCIGWWIMPTELNIDKLLTFVDSFA